jgi:flagellar hook-length control protein FliK
MQFNPLFFPQQNSLDETSDVKSFKLSSSTYLFSDILKVYTEKDNSLNETDPANYLMFSGKSILHDQSGKTSIQNGDESSAVNLKSILEMIDSLSFPLAGKESLESTGNKEITEEKSYLSGVELEEIIRKIAYLTGTINFSQFFSNDENFISVKDNKGGEFQLSTKEILDILNGNISTKIKIESNKETLEIDVTKKELQSSVYKSDFVFFNDDAASEDIPGFSKTDGPSQSSAYLKEGDKKSSTAEIKLSPVLSSKNIIDKLTQNNSVQEHSLNKSSSPEINFTKPESGTNEKIFAASDDIKNQVYEVKLGLFNSYEKKEKSIGNEILIKITPEKNVKISRNENELKTLQFFKPEKDFIEKTGLDKTFLTSDTELVNKERGLFNLVEKVIVPVKNKADKTPDRIFEKLKDEYQNKTQEIKFNSESKENAVKTLFNEENVKNKVTDSSKNLIKESHPGIASDEKQTLIKEANTPEITPAKEPVKRNDKKAADEVSNGAKESGKKDSPENIFTIAKKSENELNPAKVEYTLNTKVAEENVAAHSKPVNKESETIKNENEQTIKSEKQQVQKSSLQNSAMDLSQKDEQQKHELQNHQNNFLSASFEKISENKISYINNSLNNLGENTKTIELSEFVDEVSKLAEDGKEKNIVLKLVPETLGKVKVSLNITDNIVSANIEVENESVKSIVQNNSENLRNSLMQQGLQLNSLNISLSSNEQKAGKSSVSKKKQAILSKIDEKESRKVSKNLGYNTYEYLI